MMLVTLCGCKKETSSTDSRDSHTQICEGMLLVHLGRQAILIPRTAQEPTLNITLEDGTVLRQLHRPQPEYGCDVMEIQNAINIRWSDYGIFSIAKNSEETIQKGTYGQLEKQILIARNEGRIEKLSDELEVINPEKVVYILQENKFPTLAGFPVVFSCDPFDLEQPQPILGSCRTSYVDPSGLYISYRFHFNQTPPLSAPKVDEEYRAHLSVLLQKGSVRLNWFNDSPM